MRKLFLFCFFALMAFCAKAQWQFTMSVKYSGQCAQYVSQYGGNIGNQTIGPFSTKSECEATRNQMNYSYNYSYGGYTCRVDIICSQCTGRDVESGSLTNSNTSPNIFGTSQGTKYSPSSAPDNVKQWINDFFKKYDTYLSNVDFYTSNFDVGGTFDDYVNSEYAELVDNYENADRNELKEADKDSTYKYVFSYYDENGIPHFKEEKVKREKIEFDEKGRPIFKGIKDKDDLPAWPDPLDPPEKSSNEVQMNPSVDETKSTLGKFHDKAGEIVDETKSTLGKFLDKAGNTSKEIGDDIIEFDEGLASASYNAFGSVGTCGSTAMAGISLINNYKEIGNDVTSAINKMARSNMTATDVKDLFQDLNTAAKKTLINTAKILCGPLAPLLNYIK